MRAEDPSPPLLIACLCAGWCTACQAYAGVFAALARQHPAHRFAWIDIEEHSDTLGDGALEIENFPTLMMLRPRDGAVLFYGTVLPHAGTVTRMLDAIAHDSLAPGQPCPPGLAEGVASVAMQLPAVA